MKTKILSLAFLSVCSIASVFGQDRTTVTANNSDISDNLDLRAVASIFGDSRDLEDFERRLNDPKTQISNLDLNGDNRVDYLRVIESVERNAHLIIIQSVLGSETFQDIATVEIERDRYNRIQAQVVGDVYMYGNNYIYEPVYAYTPVIYSSFWAENYRPYNSSWYWGYYPSYYSAWSPFPIYIYHSNIGAYINHHHHYNYVNYRRCEVAYNSYYNGRSGNSYERQYPSRSFTQRNTGYVNRQELLNNRKTQTTNSRNTLNINNVRSNSEETHSPRPTRTVRGSKEVKGLTAPGSVVSPRNSESTRTYGNTRGARSPQIYGNLQEADYRREYRSTNSTESPRGYSNPESAESPRTYENSGIKFTRRYVTSAETNSPKGVASQENTRGISAPRADLQ